MKKQLFLLLLLFVCLGASAQNFHEDDKEGLRQFLRQEGNFIHLGLTQSDTLNWTSSEAWISKMNGIIWNTKSAKRISEIRLDSKYYLKGLLDATKFEDLAYLNCNINQLTNLDVSKNANLTDLYCYNNKLTTLDVSKNTKLQTLVCYENGLTTLDISKNTELTSLLCHKNKLTGLSLPQDTKLNSIDCSNNELTSLDVSKGTELVTLYCHKNKLSSLNILENSKLAHLYCSTNGLTNLDVSKNTELIYLYCYENRIGTLDVSKNIKLIILYCSYSQLARLDISQNTELNTLNCNENKLTDLDISKNTELMYLYCDKNKLASLDISKNTKLAILSCYSNQLISLNLSKNTKLNTLSCTSNKLTSLDISKNTNLLFLDCSYNELTSLNLSENTELNSFDCNNNKLTSLDISKNTQLSRTNCTDNKLSSLNLPKDTNFKYFSCSNNELTSLDISKNINLINLSCDNNKLASLDISKNTNIIALYCYSNQLTNLDVSKNTKLTDLDCKKNKLMFSSISLLNIPQNYYYYSPQNIIEGGEIAKGSIIDLSSEYSIDNNITTYKWYTKNGAEIPLQTVGNGKFIANGIYNDTLTCLMTNAKFPKLILEYNVKVIQETYTLTDHLKFNVNNNHLVTAGQEIQIYAKTDVSNPDLVQFGLYNPVNGYLLDKIEVKSRRNFIYTCQIPASFYEGLYMIAPYVEADNAPTMILREKGSAYIDKMPIKIKADIWGRSLNVTDNITTTQYIQLNINNKANEMFEIEQNIPFKVYIPTTLAASASIGLFYTNGDFYMDITTARSTYTYTCNITDAVLGGDYIIMPYTKENGQVKVIERPEDKAYLIDRLPLKVIESDIWGFSDTGLRALAVPTTDADVSVYPNPVTDILYVNSQQAILSFDIYNIAGSLMKKADYSGNNAINVQSLPSGIYVLILKSAEGQLSFKFSKK